MFYEKQKEET
jgi:dynein heavy chain